MILFIKSKLFKESQNQLKFTGNKYKKYKDNCLILVTDHDQFDYGMIEKYSKLIIDTKVDLSFQIKL